MTFLKKLLEKAGIADLFEPRIDDEKERLEVIAWINHYLLSVIESVENDVEMEKQGIFFHIENQQKKNQRIQPSGYVQYLIKDKTGGRLELSQFSLVSCNSIKMTENYQKLKSFTDGHGYSIELKEINIDGDGVDSYESLDEYQHDFERYFVIIISGW